MTVQDRRVAIGAEITRMTGIDEALIERLVHAFYARVRRDALIGPVFDARVDDWDTHLQRMCAFWSSVALMSGRYHGRPTVKHLPLPVDARHFDRWLALFQETARELCTPAGAEHFIERAQRIAESLELAIANQDGQLLSKNQRHYRPDEEVFLPGGASGRRETA